MSTMFIFTVFLMKLEFSSLVFSLFFTKHRQFLLQSLVIRGKNVPSSNRKSTKKYSISNKNKNVTCLIGWFFIILFSFPFAFIYTSLMFAGSCNITALENLKCVSQQGLNWHKTSQISHFIHHSKGKIIFFPKHMSLVHF